MTTFEYLNSLIGKTVVYENTMPMLVTAVRATPYIWVDEEGTEHTSYTYSITENGWSWYTATKTNVVETLTKEQAIQYCYDNKDRYLSECGNEREFQCLITMLEEDTIGPINVYEYF